MALREFFVFVFVLFFSFRVVKLGEHWSNQYLQLGEYYAQRQVVS